MSRIDSIEVHHYRIPPPAVLSDSTHGEMSCSGLVVAQVHDTDGAEGIDHTCTVNDVGSRAIRALMDTGFVFDPDGVEGVPAGAAPEAGRRAIPR